MYDIIINPITLLCLGIIFSFTSLLFFYFNRKISFLEKSQMEQAHILQGFITNMEMTQRLNNHQRMHKSETEEDVLFQNNNKSNSCFQDSNELIYVSDNESSDDESSDDESSDDESSDDESQVIQLNDAIDINDVKIIQLDCNNLEKSNIEIASLEELQNIVDIDNIDDDVTVKVITGINDIDIDNIGINNIGIDEIGIDEIGIDESSDDESTDDESSEDESDIIVNNENEIKKLEPVDYKSLNVKTLRHYCISCGLLKSGHKKNKKEMLKLLDEMKNK